MQLLHIILTTITVPHHHNHHLKVKQHLSMCCYRGLFLQVEAFLFILVLSFALFGPATCGPCLNDGVHKSEEFDSCGFDGDSSGLDFQDVISADGTSGYYDGSSVTRIGIKSVCTDSQSFCFPSTLSGLSSKENKLDVDSPEFSRTESGRLSSIRLAQGFKGASNRSWLSDSGMFKLFNGQTVSCALSSIQDVDKLPSLRIDSANPNDISSCRCPSMTKKSTSVRLNMHSDLSKSSSFDVSSPSCVEISPPVLDWGHKHLFYPSIAFLTIANTCNDSILHVYEPFSTNIQFYPCNFRELTLGPGEVASICFVFLPRWLGFSSAHFILQTSFGGFLVQIKGSAIESPYKISPGFSLDTSSSGRLIKNLSLFNPFEEKLYVKEISAWVSISQGNVSHHTEAICSLGNFQESDGLSLLNVEDWLVVKSGQVEFPLMAMRPHGNWEIGPHNTETVIEIDLSFETEARLIGTLCVQLLRSSQDKPDTILVPLEIDLDGKLAQNDNQGSISVSLEALLPYHSDKILIALSLRNGAPHALRVIKINEVAAAKGFMVKYIQGLLLFPGTVTQVATIECSQLLDELDDSPPEMSTINKYCKFVVLTNDSSGPQIEIPCQNVIRICLRHQKGSSIVVDTQSENAESGGRRTESLESSNTLPSDIMALEAIEGDEFVLENWKSLSTSGSLSVLDDHEVLFPMVQIGTQHSKWITVKNPSKQPVIMQLILNSGEIIDKCRGMDGVIQTPSIGTLVYNKFTVARHGFSIAEGARTEAYVHPYSNISFGPIIFHPSSRCGWASSALIRNNLSGVEWLSLKGFGGSLSLVLLEGSEPVQSVEFDLNLPFPLNISPPDLLSHSRETTYACSQPLSKELYAKNTGDLPLEVKQIKVSGAECGSDGFTVRTCNPFSLEPGESMKLLISYQSDFHSVMLQRDLELALPNGVFVIPMKANLPLNMFNLCKKSVFWMRLKKFSGAVLLSVALIFLIFCCIFPQVIGFGSHDYLYKGEKSPISLVKSSVKSACLHHNQKSNKFSVSTEIDSLLRSVGEGKTTKCEYGFKCPNCDLRAPDEGSTVQNEMSTQENGKEVPSLLSKSVAVESSTAVEACQPCNLTIKIGKDKGRRRRKRKGVFGGLNGLVEVSSSQSGNSTPSSPLSPMMSHTPNPTWLPSHDSDTIEARNLSPQVSDKQYGRVQVAEPSSKTTIVESRYSLKKCSYNFNSANLEDPPSPRKAIKEPAIPSSAPIPSACSPTSNVLYVTAPPASTPTIAPYARAPGPKLHNQTKVEKVGGDYTYDIWGNHFSELHLVGSSSVTPLKTIATENNSNSFFVQCPQALVTKTQPKTVSYIQEEG